MSRTLLLVGLTLLACRRPPPPPSPQPVRVSLLAVGDLLMHQDVKRSAQVAEGGFLALWSDLLPRFSSADLVLGNLETPIAPVSGAPGRPFVFNAPAELPRALRVSGIRILSTANNHGFDQGHQGLRETLARLQAEGLSSLGSGLDRHAAEAPLLLECQGLRFAFLGRTDIFNTDLNQEETRPWIAALDVDRLEAQVRSLRSQVDVLVLSVHWGNEYQLRPSARQKTCAARLVAAGVDLIVGHHPHVLQPLVWIEAGGRRGAVAYSLGNFISNQDRHYRWTEHPPQQGDSRDGGLLEAIFVQEPGASAQLESVQIHPLWTENQPLAQGRRIRTLSLETGFGLDPALVRLRAQRFRTVMTP